MVGPAIRRIAWSALLLVVALVGPGAGSMSPPRVAQTAAIAVPAAPAPPTPPDPAPVPANLLAPPVRLQIPSLNVDAAVEALGVDAAGAMETPSNVWDVGWYRAGPSPGGTGDAVIDGHVGLPGSPLVFSRLAQVALGADVIAILADGMRSRFSVTALQRWPASAHPDGLFSADGQRRLSLITCAGAYDRGTQSYADRLVVETIYVGPA